MLAYDELRQYGLSNVQQMVEQSQLWGDSPSDSDSDGEHTDRSPGSSASDTSSCSSESSESDSSDSAESLAY